MEEIEESFKESSYCTTWGTAVVQIENPKISLKISLANNTIRQIVHVSASGENIRLKLSNKSGETNLEIKEITIADSISQGTGNIDIKSLSSIFFNGKKNIIIPPGEEIYSDTIPYHLKALSEIAISIYFGETPEKSTGHKNSYTFSFIDNGNKVHEQKISLKNEISHWYFISAIEVYSNPIKKAIVCFGDSITDGTGSIPNKKNRWIDLLSEKLHLNKETSEIAVVNKGIGGNKITKQGLNRYSYDVLQVKGVIYIIVLFGINDISCLKKVTSSDIISAYKKLIKEAHNNNIFIYGGTILPFGKNKEFSEKKEKIRQEVNNWIRNTKKEEGGFDYFFDFDKLIRDPNNHTIMYEDYARFDGIHPNEKGHQILAQAFDNLEIFTIEPNFDKDSNVIK